MGAATGEDVPVTLPGGGSRLVTVTPNPALDVTYRVDALLPGGEHRVREVRQRAGGKGINTGGVLRCLGLPVLATGLLGGDAGRDVAAGVRETGAQARFVEIGEQTRRTVVAVADTDHSATLFNEPGPQVTPAEWELLLDEVEVLGQEAAVVTISGSLPTGVPPEAYGDLVSRARAGRATVVVDTSGPALPAAVAAGADLVKPNAAELADVTGVGDLAQGAALLRGERSTPAVLASGGADGLLLLSAGLPPLRARLMSPLHGNPTGAGDAVVAAVAASLSQDSTGLVEVEAARRLLAYAVAVSAAAVLAPVAGVVDRNDVERLLPEVVVTTS